MRMKCALLGHIFEICEEENCLIQYYIRKQDKNLVDLGNIK